METRACQNCKTNFTIEPDDFGFYEKIKVPPPTWCPECRQLRRYAWRNERTLYRRNCDLCGKSTVTIYSSNKPHKVYCNECWWGDGWDFASYGRDFDFSRPFFEQFRELQLQVPRMALLNKRSVNSEYTNHSGDNKNVYMTFSTFDCENIYYSTWMMKNCRDCTDCSYVYEAGERLYEVIDSRKSYQCQYSLLLKDCVSCLYSYDLHGCSNCFMCSDLRGKSYCFKNVQYSREEYLKKISEYDLGSHIVREGLYKEWLDMLQSAVHRYRISERTVNSTGNLLFDTRNMISSFDQDKCEDGKHMYSNLEVRTSMDMYHVGYGVELGYECHGCTRTANCQFCHLCYDNMNVMYSDTCQNSQNLFGCVSVKKGEYMILNKKYEKGEYKKLKEEIITHMKKTGEFGEFFPPRISPVCYNETQGNFYLPMARAEVLAKGWQWQDEMPGTFGKETVNPDKIPDKISDISDAITKEVLKCMSCSKNYNIVPFELSFYRRENVPIPRLCPNCRYKRRFDLRLPRKLWSGSCQCEIETHPHHLDIRCPSTFETPYDPQYSQKVYCEQCYNKEVY